MVDLQAMYFGARLWIWLYLGGVIFFVACAVIYWKREAIRGVYYRFRYPEKTLKVIVHYMSGFFKVYWRVVPDGQLFKVDKKAYLYDDDQVVKEDDFYVLRQNDKKQFLLIVKNLFTKIAEKGKLKGKEIIHIGDTEEYEFNRLFCISHTGRKYSEIHYMFNYPSPLKFNISTGEMEFTADTLKKFQENDVLNKLLAMKGERAIMMIVIGLCAFNLLLSLFIVSKMMGWIK